MGVDVTTLVVTAIIASLLFAGVAFGFALNTYASHKYAVGDQNRESIKANARMFLWVAILLAVTSVVLMVALVIGSNGSAV